MIESRVLIFLLIFGGFVVFSIAVCAILIVLIVSTNLIKEVRLRNEAEKELSISKFDFEKQLALVRVRLERNAQQSRNKADFAEKTLAAFYEVKTLLDDVRQKKENFLRTYSNYRSVKQKIDERFQLEQFLKSHCHGAFALFGEEAALCYSNFIDLLENVRSASNHLAEAEILDQTISSEQRDEYEKLIWQPAGEPDAVAVRIKEIMNVAYRVFGAAINTPFVENPDG